MIDDLSSYDSTSVSTDHAALSVRAHPLDDIYDWEPDEDEAFPANAVALRRIRRLLVLARPRPPQEGCQSDRYTAAATDIAEFLEADEQTIGQQCEGLVDHLERLAFSLGPSTSAPHFESWRAEAFRLSVSVLLDKLSEAVGDAASAADWSKAAALRGRYLSWWHKSRAAPLGSADAAAPTPRRLAYLKRIGEQVGCLHRSGLIHGTLLLESFDASSRMQNFARTCFAESSASPGMLEDLITFRHQVSQAEFESFEAGYRITGNAETEALLTACSNRCKGADDADVLRGITLPALKLPHFTVRAVGYSLRNLQSVCTLAENAFREAFSTEDPKLRVDMLVEALRTGADLAPALRPHAVDLLLSTLYGLHRNGATSQVVELSSLVFEQIEFVLTRAQRIRLGLWRDLARIGGSAGDGAALAMSSAGAAFVELDDLAFIQEGARLSLAAVESAETEVVRGCCLAAALRDLIAGAARERQDRYLWTAVELAANVLPRVRDPNGDLRRLARTAEQMLALTEKQRRNVLWSIAASGDAAQVAAELSTALSSENHVFEPAQEPPVSEEAKRLFEAEQWSDAAALLRRELIACEQSDPDGSTCVGIAATFCAALSQVGDIAPQSWPKAAQSIADIVFRYSPSLLRPPGSHDLSDGRAAGHASNLGYAATQAAAALQEDQVGALLTCAIDLLELAVRLSPAATCATAFVVYANNLSIAYQSVASRQQHDQALASLQRSIDLLNEVIEVDERLAASASSAERRIASMRCLDLHNFGRACHAMAAHTYTAQWLHLKSIDSALWYRRALLAFTQASALARTQRHAAIAATAYVNYGHVLLDLCEHFVAERHSAGGDLHRAFYDWLCAVAGGHVGTKRFVDACVGGLLATVGAADVEHRNGSLAIERVHLMVRIFRLTERHSAVSVALRRQLLVSILEAIEKLPTQVDEAAISSDRAGLRELEALLRAMLAIELFRAGNGRIVQLQEACSSFRKLYSTGGVIARGFAGPYARWLDVGEASDGLFVNGLFVGQVRLGLEFRIPSQRRAVTLGGVAIQNLRVRIRDRLWMEQFAGLAAAHAQPQMCWDDVPSVLATLEAVGSASDVGVTLEAGRIPVTGWDNWMVNITRSTSGVLQVAPSITFIGTYDVVARSLDTSIPARVQDASRKLLFGQQGMTLEVTLPLTRSGSGAGDASLSVTGSMERPLLRIDAPAAVLLLKTAPRVTTADIAYLVSTETPGGPVHVNDEGTISAALCCCATMPSTTPSFSVPSTVLHRFAPLFFFENDVPAVAVSLIKELDLHEIVVIGIPSEPSAADAALISLYDPRRELLLIVEDDELPFAMAALDRLKSQVLVSSAMSLLISEAGSLTSYMEPFSNIQVVAAPRALAAGATQMLLDLAAIRRTSVDGLPVIVDGKICRLNVKGNHYGARRTLTLLPQPAHWYDLCATYRERSVDPPRTLLRKETLDPTVLAIAQGVITPRPAFLFEPTDSRNAAFLPLMRHVGAIPIPTTAEGLALLERLDPETVFAPASLLSSGLVGRRRAIGIPDDPYELACTFQQRVAEDHAGMLAALSSTYPHFVPSRALLEEMAPEKYVVLCAGSENSPWAYLAANYAAALGSPMLCITVEAGPAANGAAAGAENGALGRHLGARRENTTFRTAAISASSVAALEALAPHYIGVVSDDPGLALELAGEPPLATRFAIGRLAGPDLTSSSALIARAALSEDTDRPPHLDAVVAEAAEVSGLPPLPGAKREVLALKALLDRARDIRPQLVLNAGSQDFLACIANAQLVHFAGHGSYLDGDDGRSGFHLADGIVSGADLHARLSGAPLVFGNACESGLLNRIGIGGQAWSGLAAAFIAAGAVGYVGSLRPVIDATSQRLAESFYHHLIMGCPVGEALRLARECAFDPGDPTWAAYVLFGCPRVRIRTAPAGGHV
ncbi:CHAT domain-containing protein [Burkholderia sp. YR290]|nr:CHAT domain-containing protein [Burkholderia sp. YR290]